MGSCISQAIPIHAENILGISHIYRFGNSDWAYHPLFSDCSSSPCWNTYIRLYPLSNSQRLSLFIIAYLQAHPNTITYEWVVLLGNFFHSLSLFFWLAKWVFLRLSRDVLSATHTVALKPDEGESSWLAADWHCCCAKGMRVGGELGGGRMEESGETEVCPTAALFMCLIICANKWTTHTDCVGVSVPECVRVFTAICVFRFRVYAQLYACVCVCVCLIDVCQRQKVGSVE